MSYYVDSTKELEKLINNRTYIDNLQIFVKDTNIYQHSQFLTDLTHLDFKFDHVDPIDFTNFTNLKSLYFSIHYYRKVDISMLENLTCVLFSNTYIYSVDFSKCKKIKIIGRGCDILYIPDDINVGIINFNNLDYYRKLYNCGKKYF